MARIVAVAWPTAESLHIGQKPSQRPVRGMTVAEQLTVYEVGERFATMSPSGEAFVYEVAWDGRAYVAGYLPAPPSATGEGADRN